MTSPIVKRLQGALLIPHRGHRWSVVTGIAHDMTSAEMDEFQALAIAYRQERVAALEAMQAPEIILSNARRLLTECRDGTDPVGRVFARVRASRGGVS